LEDFMHAISGNLACQVAAFVYKDDQTAIGAWRDVQQISDIRGEIHDSRASFLSALKAWNDRPELNPDNAFLGIYAHMGSPGISPKSGLDPTFNPADVISWSDLAAALPRGVSTCWLVGCSSVEVTAVWDPVAGPVRKRLLVTQEGNRWLPLLKHFAVEIGMDPITYPEEMPKRLLELLPTIGRDITYYKVGPGEWVRSFPAL
jgi:hypothetical protein